MADAVCRRVIPDFARRQALSKSPYSDYSLSIIKKIATAILGFRPPQLSKELQHTGDGELINRVVSHLFEHYDGVGFDAIAVAEIDGDDIRYAGIGNQVDDVEVGSTTSFEIGSITKTLTGMLVANQIQRGVLTEKSTLAELVGDSRQTSGGRQR